MKIATVCLSLLFLLLASCEEEKEAHCVGVPTQCDELTADTCDSQPGCNLGVCGGTATSCGSISDYQLCFDQDGCTWEGDRTTGRCSGTAQTCETYEAQFQCVQDGCEWLTSECAGTPIAQTCGELSQDTCAMAAGCRWE